MIPRQVVRRGTAPFCPSPARFHRRAEPTTRFAGAAGHARLLLRDRCSPFDLAVRDVRAGGEVPGGLGVTPRVMAADALPFAGGKDALREKALEIAAKKSELAWPHEK